MRLIGFSTGAVAYSDFRRGIKMLIEEKIPAIEISALRASEWKPLCDSLNSIDLSSFRYVSIHLPSSMTVEEEVAVVETLDQVRPEWPLILHPDAVSQFELWRDLGERVCIENMDVRKSTGRTDRELEVIFRKLPEARLCFDIGHAWQVDPTMNGAYGILKSFWRKLVQVHISEVNSGGKHQILSYSTIQSFRDIADMIPLGAPIILETPLTQDDTLAREEMHREMHKANFALLPVAVSHMIA